MADAEKLFGTDGIRGKAGEYPLTPEKITDIARAVAVHFAEPGETIYVGRDPRESSPWIAESVVAGILAMGRNVANLGVVSSPSLSYIVSKQPAKAAIMITASHNPYHDNGIKVFSPDGRKLHDSVERAIEERIAAGVELYSDQPGQESDASHLLADYIEYISSPYTGTLSGIRIGLDMANGATTGIADAVFARTGAEIVPICNQPNGTNINEKCGATDTSQLKRLVTEQKLDMGAAFDGDGDRVVLIDGQGRELNGDNLLHILALDRQDKAVVATQMSNMGLENALHEHGIELIRTAVGDRYVLEAMIDKHISLGGEQSGHIILLDSMPSGDGVLGALRSIAAVQKSGHDLAWWHDQLTLLPQILENIRIEDRSVLNKPEFKALGDLLTAELGGKGRVLLRPSGTEPLVRVMVEAPNAQELIKDYVQRVKAVLL